LTRRRIGFRISDFGFRICRPHATSFSRSPQSAWHCYGGPCREGRKPPNKQTPGCGRHTKRLQHRRHTTISIEGHFPLLPLGKSRRAKPVVAFRGRVGGGWGRGKRGSRASARQNVARRRGKGAQRSRTAGQTSACARRPRLRRPRGRGPCPRTAGIRARRRARARLAQKTCQRVLLVRPPQLI